MTRFSESKGSKERRRKARIKRRAVIRFQCAGMELQGVVLNLSEGGMYIRTKNIVQQGSLVRIPLMLGQETDTELNGTVAWSRMMPKEDSGETWCGMGVELGAVPEEYIRFIENMRSKLQLTPRNVEERFEVYHRVRFGTGGDFLTEYTENLSRGGMYLTTDKPLKPGDKIRAQLDIPGIEEPLEVEGCVAYTLEPEKADELGRAPGMGVQFVDLAPEAKARLHHYIRRLEIHRSRPERRQVGSIPREGVLSEFLVPEILLELVKRSATGTLILERKGIVKLVYFQNGSPVYVESTLRAENIGQFLVRQEKLTERQLEEALSELSQGDAFFGAFLLEKKWMEPVVFATAMVEHHEEKLSNTFSWFDGKFEFVDGTDWPRTVSLIPIRPYYVIFSGIMRWYDEALISAWMGLDDQTTIMRTMMPPDGVILPPIVNHLLSRIGVAKSIRQLSEKLRMAVSQVVPVAYGLIIAGWADLSFTQAPDASQPEFKAPPEALPSPEILSLLKRWIDEDFDRLHGLNFFQLLGVADAAGSEELKKAYQDRTSRYTAQEITNLKDEAIRNKVMQILGWIKLAYDTLRDDRLREQYLDRNIRKPLTQKNQDRAEADQLLFASLRDSEGGNTPRALSGLEEAAKRFPADPKISGALGWMLFQADRNGNVGRASQLLDKAIEGDPSDSQMYYYRGEIFSHLGEWKRAEWHYVQAVRLHPGFIEASIVLELVRNRLR